jgi:hypothetical protein
MSGLAYIKSGTGRRRLLLDPTCASSAVILAPASHNVWSSRKAANLHAACDAIWKQERAKM